MPETRQGLTAEADYTAKQYYIMKDGTAAYQALIADDADGVGDNLLGALQNKPNESEAADVPKAGEIGFVICGGAVAVHDLLTTDANGKAVATTTDEDAVFGVALEAAPNGANDIIPYRAVDFMFARA